MHRFPEGSVWWWIMGGIWRRSTCSGVDRYAPPPILVMLWVSSGNRNRLRPPPVQRRPEVVI